MVQSGKLKVGLNADATRVDIGYLSLAELIPAAFKVKSFQVAGPDWMAVNRFDIVAKYPEGATKEQMPEMLQSLLEERFQLKFHRENREQNVYALVVAKGGHKLKDALPDPEKPAEPGAVGQPSNQLQINAGARGVTMSSGEMGTVKMTPGNEPGSMRMEMSRVTMEQFIEILGRFVDRPVIDTTELKGNYQVTLDLTLEVLMNMARSAGVAVPNLGQRGGPGQVADAADPSANAIFQSVQQLGLRLEPRKAPVETIVIDRLEKMPTEN
jgi:uncharacterized protein (TIGR03435 family)